LISDREIQLWVAGRHLDARDDHAIERDILAYVLDVPVGAIRIERMCRVCGAAGHGKPKLADPSGTFFSTSHSGELIGVAVAQRGPIGFDLERVTASSLDFVIGELAKEEQEALYGLPDDRRNEAFFRLWTRKEAVLKATGLGLSLPLSSFAVTASARKAAITRAAPECPEMSGWTIVDVAPGDGFVGAIVHDGHSVMVRQFAWSKGS